MDIALGVVLKGRVLQGHFGTAKVRQTDAVFSALDGAAVDLCIAEIAVAVNDRAFRIRGSHRAAVHAQAAAVFDGAVGIRGNGAVVDLHPAPVVIDAAGTLRLEVAFCCSALVNGQVCRAVDKAAVAAGGFEVAAVDGYCTGVVYDDSLYGGCGHIIQSHTTAALTKECRSILQVCMSIFASINCYIAARASCINAVAVRLHLCIIYNKGSRPNHNRIEGY